MRLGRLIAPPGRVALRDGGFEFLILRDALQSFDVRPSDLVLVSGLSQVDLGIVDVLLGDRSFLKQRLAAVIDLLLRVQHVFCRPQVEIRLLDLLWHRGPGSESRFLGKF